MYILLMLMGCYVGDWWASWPKSHWWGWRCHCCRVGQHLAGEDVCVCFKCVTKKTRCEVIAGSFKILLNIKWVMNSKLATLPNTCPLIKHKFVCEYEYATSNHTYIFTMKFRWKIVWSTAGLLWFESGIGLGAGQIESMHNSPYEYVLKY